MSLYREAGLLGTNEQSVWWSGESLSPCPLTLSALPVGLHQATLFFDTERMISIGMSRMPSRRMRGVLL